MSSSTRSRSPALYGARPRTPCRATAGGGAEEDRRETPARRVAESRRQRAHEGVDTCRQLGLTVQQRVQCYREGLEMLLTFHRQNGDDEAADADWKRKYEGPKSARKTKGHGF